MPRSVRLHMNSERGFTLVETMAAALVLVVGLLGTFLLVSVSTGTTLKNRAREGGLALAREVLETSRSLPYSDLSPGGIVPKLQDQAGLGDSNTADGIYTVKRRGVLYTVDPTVCSYDDPADASGPHDSGGFCPDSPGGGTGGTLDYGASGSTADGAIQLGGGT